MPKHHDNAQLWYSFFYEISRATASLLYLLQGMERVRASELDPYNHRPAGPQKTFAACFAKVSYAAVPLSLAGPSFDLNAVLARKGEAEQLAYKGWIEQVYNCIWDSKYRNDLQDMLEGSDIIKPEADLFGDLRLMRNDLVHNGAFASTEKTGKCKTLKWFEPSQPMVLGIRHVLDFLNQLGVLGKLAGHLPNGPHAGWTLYPEMEHPLRSMPAPALVSLRMSFGGEREDGSSWHVASVVFENGVFVNVPIDHASNGRPLRERIDWVNTTRIDAAGNLRLPNGAVKDRHALYHEALDALLDRGQEIEGVDVPEGVPGPWFRIRRDP